MTKNILIFADGTGQAGGLRPDQRLSNVYKLYRATRLGPDSSIHPQEQVAYYDPGLGTASPQGGINFPFWGTVKNIAGMAVGLGFSRNVIDCYEAILKHYQPGDRIYLFGFSRGGYTARVVANVLNLCGVPTTDGMGGSLPRAGLRLRAIAKEAVIKVYSHGAGWPRGKYEDEREELARRFRAKYGAGDDPDRADVVPHFIGVFDAVAALGLTWPVRILIAAITAIATWCVAKLAGYIAAEWLPWDPTYVFWITAALILGGLLFAYYKATIRWAPKGVRSTIWPGHFAFWRGKYFDSWLDKRIPHVRHALAIDETRKNFSRVDWGVKSDPNENDAQGNPRFVQMWFAGNHSDIGGSYPEEESRLSDVALDWMIGEIRKTNPNAPVSIDESRLHVFPDPLGMQHCEHFGFANAHPWLAKIFRWPKKPRAIKHDATLHESVRERFKAQQIQNCATFEPYRPEALRNHDDVKKYYAELPQDSSVCS